MCRKGANPAATAAESESSDDEDKDKEAASSDSDSDTGKHTTRQRSSKPSSDSKSTITAHVTGDQKKQPLTTGGAVTVLDMIKAQANTELPDSYFDWMDQ